MFMPPGEFPQVLTGQFVRLGQSVIDRGQHKILQHLDIVGIDRFGLNLNIGDFFVPGGHHLHDTASGASFHRFVAQFLLRLHHLILHFFDLFHHLIHVFHGPSSFLVCE